MHPLRLTYTPADDSTTGFMTGATGAGPFLTTTTTSGDGLSHLVSLTSAANLSGINITLVGLDADGVSQTETLAGPNINTVYSTKYYSVLSRATASATLGVNTMDIGWKDAAITPTIPLNWRAEHFDVGIAVNISGTISYTLQHCYERMIDRAPSLMTWWNHATVVTKTADAEGSYTSHITAVRLLINSLTAGAAVEWLIVQGQ